MAHRQRYWEGLVREYWPLSKLCDVSDRSLSDVNVARQLGW